jgi:hypothetical protein
MDAKNTLLIGLAAFFAFNGVCGVLRMFATTRAEFQNEYN